MAHCTTHKGLRRGMSGLPTSAVLGLTVHPSSFCLTPLSLSYSLSLVSSTPYIATSLQHLKPKHHTDWPVTVLCPFVFHSQHGEEVCYEGPVKAASTGAKPGGASLNEGAVRKPVLWWETQTSCTLRWGKYWFLSAPQQKRIPCQNYPKDGCSKRLCREYRLHLCHLKSICGLHILKQ